MTRVDSFLMGIEFLPQFVTAYSSFVKDSSSEDSCFATVAYSQKIFSISEMRLEAPRFLPLLPPLRERDATPLHAS